VTIAAASIDTGMEPRDNHLRSADFLDAESFPTLTFVSTSIEPKGDRWAITGDLSIRGVTAPSSRHRVSRRRQGDGRRRHAGFEATTRIKRSDWGLTWNVGLEAGGFLVSDDVMIELEVAATSWQPPRPRGAGARHRLIPSRSLAPSRVRVRGRSFTGRSATALLVQSAA